MSLRPSMERRTTARGRPEHRGLSTTQDLSRRYRSLSGLLTIFAAAALTAGACSGGASLGSDRCDEAFRNAVPRAGAPYGASPLDDAVRQCASVAEWRSAWERIPTSHGSRDDPIGFLLSRCGDPLLAQTALCRQAAQQR